MALISFCPIALSQPWMVAQKAQILRLARFPLIKNAQWQQTDRWPTGRSSLNTIDLFAFPCGSRFSVQREEPDMCWWRREGESERESIYRPLLCEASTLLTLSGCPQICWHFPLSLKIHIRFLFDVHHWSWAGQWCLILLFAIVQRFLLRASPPFLIVHVAHKKKQLSGAHILPYTHPSKYRQTDRQTDTHTHREVRQLDM